MIAHASSVQAPLMSTASHVLPINIYVGLHPLLHLLQESVHLIVKIRVLFPTIIPFYLILQQLLVPVNIYILMLIECDITCRECVDVNANSCTKCVSDALCPINEIANVGRCLPCSSCYIDLTPTYLDTLPPVICRSTTCYIYIYIYIECHHYCQECNSYSNQLEPSLCEQCLSSPGIINSTGICECDITSGYMEVEENGKTVCISIYMSLFHSLSPFVLRMLWKYLGPMLNMQTRKHISSCEPMQMPSIPIL